MQIKEITNYLERLAPLAYQESYDNAGLLVGNAADEVSAALLTLDVTEEIIEEAIYGEYQLIIAHHPLIFSGIKKINGKNEVERCLIKAIRHNIAVYAAHTNLDNVSCGVNKKICEKLHLQDCRILAPMDHQLVKLVTYVPEASVGIVQEALFQAGAGHIGSNYDSCGFSVAGTGQFRALKGSHPYVGMIGEVHHEKEVRFETIFPARLQPSVIAALTSHHPYEEVAYDLYPLKNACNQTGAGMIGLLSGPVEEEVFLHELKNTFHCKVVRHSPLLNRTVRRVAVCGGAGSFLISKAIRAKADIFITGDLKYHEFFQAENQIILADIGHFESEQFTKEVFHELLTKKFPKFAIHLSEINTNPVNYLI